jgi:hypothetical protein
VLPKSTKRAYREWTLTLFCGGSYTDTSRDRLVRCEPGSFRRSPHSSGSDLPPQAITIRGQTYSVPLFNVQRSVPKTHYSSRCRSSGGEQYHQLCPPLLWTPRANDGFPVTPSIGFIETMSLIGPFSASREGDVALPLLGVSSWPLG